MQSKNMNCLKKLKTYDSWTPEEKRVAEIWNTLPESLEQRQALINELSILNPTGVKEYVNLLDAAACKKCVCELTPEFCPTGCIVSKT